MTKEEFKTIHTLLNDAIKKTKFASSVFYVGGCIRSIMLGQEIRDIDMVVTLPNSAFELAETITKTLNCYKSGSNPILMPTSKVVQFKLGDALPKLGDVEIQISNSTNLETNAHGTIQQDATTRDFTINAVYARLSDLRLFDASGMSDNDYQMKIIRTVTDADKVFTKDPIRILRAIRFACDLDFNIERSTWVGMCKHARKLNLVTKERLRDEFNKIILSKNARKGIMRLIHCGAMHYFIPELEQLENLTQGKQHYEDVLQHSLTVMSKTLPIVENRLSGLLHDVGKFAKKQTGFMGDIKFIGHEQYGSDLAYTILDEMKYPKTTIVKVTTAIENHMRFKGSQNPSNGSIRKFIDAVGEDNVELCLDLIEADNTSHVKKYCINGQTKKIRDRIERMAEKETLKVELPITGTDVMKIFGLPSGPTVGSALNLIKQHMMISPKLTKEEAVHLIKDALEKEKI